MTEQQQQQPIWELKIEMSYISGLVNPHLACTSRRHVAVPFGCCVGLCVFVWWLVMLIVSNLKMKINMPLIKLAKSCNWFFSPLLLCDFFYGPVVSHKQQAQIIFPFTKMLLLVYFKFDQTFSHLAIRWTFFLFLLLLSSSSTLLFFTCTFLATQFSIQKLFHWPKLHFIFVHFLYRIISLTNKISVFEFSSVCIVLDIRCVSYFHSIL